MIFVLVPSLVVAASLVLAGRVVYRRMPKDKAEWDEAVSRESFGPTFYQKALASAAAKSKEVLLGVSTKLVYRLKITSLKSDNFLSQVLQKIKRHKAGNGSGNAAPKVSVASVPSVIVQPKTEIDKANFNVSSILSAEENNADSEKIVVEPDPFSAQEQQFVDRLAYNPKDISVYKKLGWLYLENNLPIQARQAFKMAVKLGSKDRLVMAKLLEIGGVLHKEGSGEYVPSQALAPARGRTGADKSKKTKTRKL